MTVYDKIMELQDKINELVDKHNVLNATVTDLAEAIDLINQELFAQGPVPPDNKFDS